MSFKEIFMNGRYLFIKSGCPHCREYLKFIESINMRLENDKKIKVIDCNNYDTFGIIDDPIILIFRKKLTSYPTLFFDGMKMEGAMDSEILEQFVKTLVMKDLLFSEEIKYLFMPDCKYEKRKILGNRLICES